MAQCSISLVDNPDGYRSLIIHAVSTRKPLLRTLYDTLRLLFIGDKRIAFIDDTKDSPVTDPLFKVKRQCD